jgi:hypothetical protein
VNGPAETAEPVGVRTTMAPVVAPGGTVAVIWVPECTVKLALAPLKVTSVTPPTPWPRMAKTAPTCPTAGSMRSIVGAGRSTVKVPVAVPPCGWVAVITVAPTARAVARPPGDVIVATVGTLLVQVTAWVTSCVVPSQEVAVACNWSRSPTERMGAARMMARVGGGAAVTVRTESALTAPSRAVMVVLPSARPVARPPGERIVATFALLLVHTTEEVRSCVEPSAYVATAWNCTCAPMNREGAVGVTARLAPGGNPTVRTAVAVPPPSDPAVMVTVPRARPVTLPFAMTFATAGLLLVQVLHGVSSWTIPVLYAWRALNG